MQYTIYNKVKAEMGWVEMKRRTYAGENVGRRGLGSVKWLLSSASRLAAMPVTRYLILFLPPWGCYSICRWANHKAPRGCGLRSVYKLLWSFLFDWETARTGLSARTGLYYLYTYLQWWNMTKYNDRTDDHIWGACNTLGSSCKFLLLFQWILEENIIPL